jgi:multidrug efflux pump subunit AcrB
MSKRIPTFRADDSFFAFTVKRPVAILMIVTAVAVFGAVSYQRLALTLMPNMSYPTLTVRTAYPGTAPEEIESVISRPLEQQLGIIPKLVSISSISKAGQSDVILEFQWKTDMDMVAQEVREKIDRLRLPDGAQRPLLLHFDPSMDPILRIGLSGPQSLYELRHLAEHEIKRRLESLPGVAAIQVKGGLEEQFLVALDENKLATLRLDITQIGQRLQQGNVNMPGGNLREGQTEYVIRTLNEFRSLEEIGALIVSRSNNAVDIRLRDIATVTRFHKDRDVITRVNGQESVELEIYKEADANVVVVAQTVREALFGTAEQQAYVEKMVADAAQPSRAAGVRDDRSRRAGSLLPDFKSLLSGRSSSKNASSKTSSSKTSASTSTTSKSKSAADARKAAIAAAAAEAERNRAAAQELVRRRTMTSFVANQLPPGASLSMLADQSVFISRSIEEVKNNAIFGGLIAICVLFLFLRKVSQTVIIGLTIPVSVVATFAPMYMADVSLNIISLGGLALGIGMLVDNGIVVLESIFRCREEGDDLLRAVVRGTHEVGMAVVASTMTTVAVFFPIVFVEGVAGQVFGDMALTVVFSLLASLAAALFLIPMLASRRLNAPVGPGGEGDRGASGLRAAGTRALTSSYLQFPAAAPGASGVVHALRVAATMLLRLGTAGLVLAGVAVKFVAVAGLLALAPLLWLVDTALTVMRRRRAAGADGVERAPARRPVWARCADWAAADRLFGPLYGARVWPGLLSFTALPRLAATVSEAAAWLTARRWRWLALLVVPALVVVVVLLVRSGAAPAAAAAAPAAPAGPGPAIAAAAKPWYGLLWQWLAGHPWWLLVGVFIPGVFVFVFTFARAAAEVALRLAATLVQTVALAVAQVLVALVRMFTTVAAPLTGGALSYFETGYSALQRGYPRLIGAALRNRLLVLGGAAAAFALCWFLILPKLGRELIPQVRQGEFNLDITLPIGTPLERTAGVAGSIDEVVREQPEVQRTALTVGAEEGANTSIEAGEHTARLTVKMKSGLPRRAELVLIDRIREEFRDFPEVKLEVSYPALFSFRSPVEVEIRGHDLAVLKRLSREAEALLPEAVPGLVDVRSTLQTGHPEIQVEYNRDRLAEYGLNLRSVADLVRNKVQGRTATTFRRENQMIDIVVRLREEDRFGIEELRRLVVNPNGVVPIPLSTVATLTINEGPSEIRRIDQQRTALITANIRGADLASVSRDIIAAMSTLEMPAGFSFGISGQNKEMQTSLNSLLMAFALALFLVYIVMASQFESLVQPLLIMMTVPLALIGVGAVLLALGIPISIMVFLGLIILAGIVVNNAIVLIDYINRLRGRGLELAAAITEAGRARLRPILMTTLTTVLGLVPMALGLGEGAEIRAPMAITVIVGLASSTLLTLVVIPTLYYQFAGKRAPERIEEEPEPAEEFAGEREVVTAGK